MNLGSKPRRKLLRPFTCRFCHTLLLSLDRFRLHLIRHRRKYSKTTLISCIGTLSEKSNFYHHVKSNLNVKRYFNTSQERLITMVSCSASVSYPFVPSSSKPYQCKLCFKCFTERRTLKIHLAWHTNEKPHKCEICQKSFAMKTYLNRHKKTHLAEKPFKCSYCDRGFTQKQSLVRHIRTHTKEKPYQCGFCERRFADNATLTGHLRIHTNEKPWQCEYCQKCFADRRNLKQHIRVHSKEKPYHCSYCQKSFAQSSACKRHVKSNHERKPKPVEKPIAKSTSYGAIIAHLAANLEQANPVKNILNLNFSSQII